MRFQVIFIAHFVHFESKNFLTIKKSRQTLDQSISRFKFATLIIFETLSQEFTKDFLTSIAFHSEKYLRHHKEQRALIHSMYCQLFNATD